MVAIAAIDSRVPTGRVVVKVKVNASPAMVYTALTDPVLTTRWFGDLNRAIEAGRHVRLDFGDGDFFDIEDIVVDRPRSIAYRWRFLGIMPADNISWSIEPAESGALVTVTDREPFRAPEWADAVRQGWHDFTSRLSAFLASGESTRYDWRRTFDGGVELPCQPVDAMTIVTDPALAARWLPTTQGLIEGARFEPGDGLEPSFVHVGEIVRDGPAAVRFTMTSRQWQAATGCTMEARPRGAGTLLTLEHSGWEDIDGDCQIQRMQRHRFADMWISALRRAYDLFIRKDECQNADH
jgi:uncharacterized protein YndB with AHSA1/START domain